ncbi:MAG: bioD [Alphaproteobacteria bacterium]|jgi:dethiobiotin synthetase|nr:bioD [Alphaproteobacteria bacterium]MDB5741078.1 bioD [Alphaproteobacteria bacterium]
MKFVVSGTDTDIGKTVFCAGLCGFLNLPYWKPVQAGEPGDSETVAELSGVETLPEAYRLQRPASPHQAAAEEGITIDPNALTPPDGDMVIEGAGGLMVPLTDHTLFIDVFARWKLPLILCARTRLGTINHTLLSLEALRSRAIPVHGVAFIGEANDESERIICAKGQVKRLGRLPVIAPLTPGRLQAVFAKCFNKADFA